MKFDQELSPMARERMTDMLPNLLGKIRWRRRRRYAVRSGVVVAMLALLVVYWPASELTVQPEPKALASGSNPELGVVCQIVHDDPAVLERYRSESIMRAEWLVDDTALQAFLQASDRPKGIVRIGDKVLVASEVVDPIPEHRTE